MRVAEHDPNHCNKREHEQSDRRMRKERFVRRIRHINARFEMLALDTHDAELPLSFLGPAVNSFRTLQRARKTPITSM